MAQDLGVSGPTPEEYTVEDYEKAIRDRTDELGRLLTREELSQMTSEMFPKLDIDVYDTMEMKIEMEELDASLAQAQRDYKTYMETYEPDVPTKKVYEEEHGTEEEVAYQESLVSAYGDKEEIPVEEVAVDEYDTSMEDAEMLTKLKEQAIIEQLLMGQKGAMVGEMVLEEMQGKYGISGGMALAQETQRQAQVAATQQPLYGALSMLPYEQKLLEGEFASAKTVEEREATTAYYQEQFSKASLDELLLNNEMLKLYSGGDE